ncbi:MAG: hypothetical protein K2I06_12170, partial [Ruminococcus sp.]|nr:hypothetical protein [Ruminococcus sp.]
MLKKVLAGTAAALLLASISPIMTIANNTGNGGTSATIPSTLRSSVTVDAGSGEVTIISSGAKDEKITTFRLNLTSLKAIDFQFCENAESMFDIYYSKLSDDSKSLNIYVYKQNSLFDDNDSLVIGTVSNPTYVKAENMDYVSGNDVVTLDTKLRTYVPETVAKSDNAETDAEEVDIQVDVYGLEAGEQFRNLNYSLLTTTSASTSKVMTTTTAIPTVTTTTTKRTRSTTTTEEAVDTTTKAVKPPKPTTTSTTSTTTSTTSTTSTTEPTTTSTTSTTTTTTSTTKPTATSTTSTTTSTTSTTEPTTTSTTSTTTISTTSTTEPTTT